MTEKEISFLNTEAIIIGVVSDTHVPDRTAALHPDLLPLLHQAGVSHILHAGDICSQAVLDRLETVAPVTAVRGNRDWAFAGRLPWQRDFELGGLRFSLMHGMGNWGKYLEYKVRFGYIGYRLEHYLPLVQKAAPDADIIVFGHTHFPEIIHEGGQFIFNPGSTGLGRRRGWKPTFGLIKIQPDQTVAGAIHELG